MTPAAQPVRLLRAAGVISVAYIFSRIMGYVREAFLAARFGATHTTDAYLVAQDLPTFIFQAVSAALVMVFIPVYQQVLGRRGPEATGRLFNVVLTSVILAAAAVAGLGWLLAPVAVPAIVPGLPPSAQALAVELTRIMVPTALFLGITGVATATLNAHRHFAAPAFTGLISNLCVVGALAVVTRPEQIAWVAAAYLIGSMLGSVVQVPPLLGAGIRYRVLLDWTDPGLLRIGRLLLPVVLTLAIAQFQSFVDRFMASGLAEGSISALSYAQRVSTLPYGVVGVAVATVLYPGLAEQAALGRIGDLRRTTADGLRIMTYLLLPMSLGLFAFREPIVQLFFQRGAFDVRATVVTALALRFLAPGVLFGGWLDFMNRSFLALQDTITPLWTAVAMILANLVLNQIFVRLLGLGGLALGTSLSTALAAGILVWRLRRRVGGLGGRALLRSLLVSLVTASAGTLTGLLVFAAVPGEGTLGLAVRLALGLGTVMAAHILLSMLLGSREGIDLLVRLRRNHETKGERP